MRDVEWPPRFTYGQTIWILAGPVAHVALLHLDVACERGRKHATASIESGVPPALGRISGTSLFFWKFVVEFSRQLVYVGRFGK